MYNDSFHEALENLEKVVIRFQETNLSLSDAKCCMLQSTGIFLSKFISCVGIQVDPMKVEVISKLPVPLSPKYVNVF
jgi:hypothetical protein